MEFRRDVYFVVWLMALRSTLAKAESTDWVLSNNPHQSLACLTTAEYIKKNLQYFPGCYPCGQLAQVIDRLIRFRLFSTDRNDMIGG